MSSTFDPYYKWLGIRPEEQPPNHYRLLGVALFESDPDVISSAADQRMVHVRSFQSGAHSAESQKVLNEIAAARVCLLNPQKKAAYDETLRRAMAAVATPPFPKSEATAQFPLDLGFTGSLSPQQHASAQRRRNVEPWHISLIALAVILLAGVTAVLLTRGGADGKASPTAKAVADERLQDKKTHVDAADSNRPVTTAKHMQLPTVTSGDKHGSHSAPESVPNPPTPPIDPPGEWISRDASYVVSSQYAGHFPLNGLLTDEGVRHWKDSISIYTDPNRPEPPNIVITLTNRSTLQGFYIQNRTDGDFERAAGLTVWVSPDQKDWQKVWTADAVAVEWRFTMPKPVMARYVKIGLPTSGILHLRTVKLFGRKGTDPPEYASKIAAVASFPTAQPQGTAATQPISQPQPPAVTQPTAPAAAPRPAVPEADTRHPIPDAEVQSKGMKLIKEVFGEEYAAAKTAEQKKALARTLLTKATESQDDPTSKYLLLKLAKDIATQGGDDSTVFGAIDEMAKSFQVDALEMKAEALTLRSKTARLGAEHRALARQTLSLVELAVASDRFGLANQLGDFAVSEANAAHDTELAKQVRTRVTWVRELASAYEDTAKALATLKEQPTSPEANLTAGRYYCFNKGDWAQGLPMLALGSDPALKELAAKDVQGTQAADEQLKFGDGWWELAEKEEEVVKKSMGLRAAFWYKRALPQLTGLTKGKVEKRLEELTSDVAGDAPGSESLSKLASAIVGHFQVGMLQRKTKQRQIVFWEFRQDRSLWEKNRQVAEWSATDTQVRVVFSDKALGEAILRLKGRDLFIGTQIRANDEAWACELQKVFVVAVWEHHWGGNSQTIKCWSTGRFHTPDSPHIWEVKGSKIIFRFQNGGVDTCTLAPDGKSFKGSNQFGLPIWGKLISEK